MNEEIFKELVTACLASEAGREIDAGCCGEGPLARAIVAVGMAEDTDAASKMIYGDDCFDDDLGGE